MTRITSAFCAYNRSLSNLLFAGEAVYPRSTVGGDYKWILGLVVRQSGQLRQLYEVRDRDSDTVHRHHGDQLQARITVEPDTDGPELQTEQFFGKD